MTSQQRKKELRKRFKELFKLGKAGAKVMGSSFDTSYIKSLAKNDKGLEQIKKIYSEVLIPLDKKMMTYLQGKSLEEALGFNIKSQNELVETLENFVKTKTDESRDIFLTAGLGFSPEEVDNFDFSFKEEKPKQPEAVGIPEAQKEIMKGVERAKIKMVDKVQEKGEKKLTVEEMKKITESLVDTALANAVKEIEKKEKLNKEQKEIIREQIEKEIEDKIKESSELAGLTVTKEMVMGKKSIREDKEDEEDEPILTRKQMKKQSEEISRIASKVKEDTALANAVKEIEKKEKLNKEQKEIIREQIEKEIEDKIKESSELAGLTVTKEMEQPTMSTDERDVKEEMKEEKEAQTRAKEMRSQPKPKVMTEEEKEEVKTTVLKSKDIEDPKPTGEAIEEPLETVGSLSDFIPPVRLVTKGKSSKDLLEDINFFIKNFPKQLENEKEILGRIDKNKITDVRKLHARIVGKVRPSESKRNSKDGSKVGVVVNADSYIREKLKEILQEQTFSNLRPADVVIDVGSKPTKESDSKDYGSFEVKSNAMGGLYAQREPIYRYLPSENDPNVGEKDLSIMEKKKPKRLELQKPKSWNIRNSTIRNYKKDPFKSKQKTMRLNYLD